MRGGDIVFLGGDALLVAKKKSELADKLDF